MTTCRNKYPKCTSWVDDGYGSSELTQSNMSEVLSRKDDRWVAGGGDATMGGKCCVDPLLLKNLPGKCGEETWFVGYTPTKRTCFSTSDGKCTEKWQEFVDDIRKNGVKEAVFIIKEKDGRIFINEGNHRIRAAIQAGLKDIPVEFRYFGNSQRKGLIPAHKASLESEPRF